MRRRAGATLVLALIAIAAVGCKANDPVARGSRAIYKVLAPDYRRYVEADASLDAAQKANRFDTLAAWDLLIRKAEGK